ncbi:unnamed protein product [Paramecium octaurelia]|uniref:Uncharacterized protein n=1 Tax=Paramecium octaurelia TaxID=43137 RepID=A0A8S1YC20_PAROT|nr:unnamed protein product [Paramecium octaurelia]
MKLLIYLIQLMIYWGESQPTWKVIYDSKNWESLGTQQVKQSWHYSHVYGGPFSYCGDARLFGGYSVFGKSSLVSSSLTLPTHISVKITFDFWKIDSWDSESFLYLFDNYVASQSFAGFQGLDICGITGTIYREYVETITTTLSPHLSSSLVLFMTSDLNSSADDESWGFNNFKIEIEECPEGCTFCQDSTISCNQWINFASYWPSSNESDVWQIDNNQPLGYSKCASLEIAGGIDKLFKGQSISNLIQNLPTHFKVHIVVKLWVIGIWNQEAFYLNIDNQSKYSTQIYSLDSNFQCTEHQVKIINIDVNAYHTSQEIDIKMKSVKNLEENAYWGVSSFNLYVAKCSIGCEECNWDEAYKCIRCIKKWGSLNSECIPAPPLECSFVRINDIFRLKTNSINLFELTINELDLVMTEIGQKQLFVDDIISNISIQVQVQCQQNMEISSFFRNCNECQSEEYSFINQCTSQSNILIYNAIFIQVVESEKELLITMSQQKIEIIQVSIINDVETQVSILKIEI